MAGYKETVDREGGAGAGYRETGDREGGAGAGYGETGDRVVLCRVQGDG